MRTKTRLIIPRPGRPKGLANRVLFTRFSPPPRPSRQQRTPVHRECLRRIRCLRVPEKYCDDDGRNYTPSALGKWARVYIFNSLKAYAGQQPKDWKARLVPGPAKALPLKGPYVCKGSTDNSRDFMGSWRVYWVGDGEVMFKGDVSKEDYVYRTQYITEPIPKELILSDHILCLALMIKHHCPKILKFLAEQAVGEMIFNTQHLYPHDNRDPCDVVYVSDGASGATALSSRSLGDPFDSDTDSEDDTDMENSALATPSREVIVIDDHEDSIREVKTKKVSMTSTDTARVVPSSKNLDRNVTVTVIFWINLIRRSRKRAVMKSLTLSARKSGPFVLADHKLIIFEKTGLVVYDHIQQRYDKNWNDALWNTPHKVVPGSQLVFRTPDAETGNWQVDVTSSPDATR